MGAPRAVVTPGKTAHDAYCSEDDWHTLDAETVALWVAVEDDVIRAYGGRC